jgi:hypothetical protein
MDATCKTKDLSQPTFSETVNGGTVCRKAARTGLRGSGEVTNRSTRNLLIRDLKALEEFVSLTINHLV